MSTLPGIYGISAAILCDSLNSFLVRLEVALETSQLRLLQVRDKHLRRPERVVYAQECVARCKPYSCQVLINDDPELAAEVDADGTHVSSGKLQYWQPSQLFGMIGFSAHNHNELQLGFERLDASFAVLSPVLKTLTHVDAQPLGWDGFKLLAQAFPKPIFALGGVRLDQLNLARQHHAAGVASMRSLWQLPLTANREKSDHA